MKKLIALLAVASSLSASSQTLFYYGKDSVTTAEFLRAFNKNNNGPRTAKALQDYLSLYTASRLKIAEAKALGYDTLPQMVADLSNLRQQILPGYLTDKKSMNRLVSEAFKRGQKDIKLSHIFINTKNANAEQLNEAEAKLVAVQLALRKGRPFSEVAAAYTDDPAGKSTGGSLGWITVFSLPYELENLAYTTAPGIVSAPYRSKAGIHIFKKEGERKALGRMKAAQILLAFPPGADAAYKARLKKQADSLYQRLQKGDDFGKLATVFSNDMYSASANGQMMEFGVGQYDGAFEAKAFGLTRDGAVTAPFETPFGYHIVKRISAVPVAATLNEKSEEWLKDKVQGSDRMRAVQAEQMKTVAQQAGMKKLWTDDAALWAYSDSILNNQKSGRSLNIKPETALLSFNKKQVTATDWIGFAQTFRYKPDGSGVKSYPELWSDFEAAQTTEYYQSHLEDFNEDFRVQLNEFKDGNLFFEIMQRQVWGPAQSDSAGLENYFNQHKKAYRWKESADALIFYATDSASARLLITQLKKSPAQWQTLVSSMSEKISADSGRFELAQLPLSGTAAKAGSFTALQKNGADNTFSFAYILRLYPAGQPRSFADARGLVMNDYQAQLEEQWLEALRKKYPVRVNDIELAKLR
jgi:peptidyl-prolyl cis-trans isomerase SurA